MTRIAMLENKPADQKRATLRHAAAMMAGVDVDVEAGVIRGAAVMTMGRATGVGFDGYWLDKTSLSQLCELINAEPDGVKVHFKHPLIKDGAIEDQLGALVGRLKNCRIEGTSLRGDVHIGEYAKTLPGMGDARAYLLNVAKDDPSAIGLSAVFAYGVEPLDGQSGQAEKLVARISKVFQVDFVGDPAANPNGLLSAVRKIGKLEASNTVKAPLAACAEALRMAIDACRKASDAAALMASTPDSLNGVIAACIAAGQACRNATNTGRVCIDLGDDLPRGTMVDEESSATATACIQLAGLCRGACYELREAVGYRAWGTSDVARAMAACTPLACTCRSTCDLLQDAVRPLTIPLANLHARKSVEADQAALAKKK